MRGLFLYDAGTLAYVLGIIFGLIFGIHYGLKAPWYSSAIGRMFMVFVAGVVVAGIQFLRRIFASPGFLVEPTFLDQLERFAGLSFFAVAMGFLLFTYLHERRKPPAERERDVLSMPVGLSATVDRMDTIKRAWYKLAPKLIAFLATGLTASGLIALAAPFGIVISPELSAVLVGAVSTVAAFIIRDNLLALSPGQFSLKVVAFVVTSATAVGTVAFLQHFGVDLSQWTAVIGLVITGAGAIVGYLVPDQATPATPRALVKHAA